MVTSRAWEVRFSITVTTSPTLAYGNPFGLVRVPRPSSVARRIASFLDPRPVATRVTVWTRASADWTRADVESTLEALLAADVALKETRVASEEQIVSTAVLAACAGSERTATAA